MSLAEQLKDLQISQLDKKQVRPSKEILKSIVTNYDINPEFQRNAEIWSKKREIEYVRDILQGRPIAPLLAIGGKKNCAKPILVDGKQRVSTLVKFLNDPEIDNAHKKIIANYYFSVTEYDETLFTDDKGKLDIEKVAEFFYKSNSRGTRLNAQELRKAYHLKKPYIKFVEAEVSRVRFKNLIKMFSGSNKVLLDRGLQKLANRCLDQEMILKMLVVFYRQDFSREFKMANDITKFVSKKDAKDLEKGYEHCLECFNWLYGRDERNSAVLKHINLTMASKFLIPAIMGMIGKYSLKVVKDNTAVFRDFLENIWVLKNTEIAEKYQLNHAGGSATFNRNFLNLLLMKFEMFTNVSLKCIPHQSFLTAPPEFSLYNVASRQTSEA